MVKISEGEIQSAICGDSSEGICIECGSTQDGCEPDAQNYECEACGRLTVFGMEQAVLEGLIGIVPDGGEK